ncbi:NAD(P)-binding protein [Mycena floridula]|nr:NAD(P)-binding protein [Mycena floridula]
MSSEAKPLIMLVGITGYTGQVIAKSLLSSGKFRVSAIIRSDSMEKPVAKEMRDSGVTLVPGDISTDGVETLTTLLAGVEVLIITVLAFVDQRPVLLAAKEAGVKRVVPSEFGPSVPRGVSSMVDLKYDIRDFIVDLDLPYTFIQIGWWLELLTPMPHSMNKPVNFIGNGEKKVAYTSYHNIGDFVLRIIQDPRTLRQLVMTWDGEATQQEIWSVSERISGEDFSDYPRLTAEDVKNRTGPDIASKAIYQYHNSLHLRGDNTVEKAVNLGAIDARVLYPDYEALPVEELARAFYEKPLVYILPTLS